MEGFQPPPIGSAILVAIILLAGNLLVILMISLCANGTIQRGGLAGIRTGATRASDAAWRAGHLAARPVAQVGHGIASVLAAASLFASATVLPYLLVLACAIAASVVAIVVSAIVAHRAADRAEA
ncbi:MAG: SdpI family protein [Pseudoclavibacter sp.]